MANLDRLTRLFNAIAAKDWSAATGVAAEVAETEDRLGHHAAAQRLRGALHPNGRANGASDPQGTWVGNVDILANALSPLPNDAQLVDVMLRPAARVELDRLVLEFRHESDLAAAGLDRRRKLLFYGPPGCGKSLTARALGRELALPVQVVRLDAVVGAYLGQTALRVRELFRYATSVASVLLIDEVDALARRRGNPLDVGELDRVVITLMQELEHSRPRGLLIATSNLPQQLDKALLRRFDAMLEFPRPTSAELGRFAREQLAQRALLSTRTIRKRLGRATSYAEVVAAINALERAAVLQRVTR